MKRATITSFTSRNSFVVSIHALNEESDQMLFFVSHPAMVSIHALNEESDVSERIKPVMYGFQSTLSMKRATLVQVRHLVIPLVSIHALNEESDMMGPSDISPCTLFQSTLSMKRATACALRACALRRVSIHALNEESDCRWTSC